MCSFNLFGLTFSCKPTTPATEPEHHEELNRQEPLLRRAAQAQDVPGNEGPRITDEQRAEAAEIYKAMVETSGKLSAHLDAHWRKLRALVEMLKPEEDEDANPAGLLLADVADSFIDGVDDFTSPPLYVQLQEYAALVGAEAKAETVKAEVRHG
jgi:hypothetical protein